MRGCAAGTARDFGGTVGLDGNRKQAGGAFDNAGEFDHIVMIQAEDKAETAAHGSADQTLAWWLRWR
jgi:hypothetical protein